MPLVDYDPNLATKLVQEGIVEPDTETPVQESTSSSLPKTSSSREHAVTAWPSALVGSSEDSDFIIGKAELEAAIFLDIENMRTSNRLPYRKKLDISVLGDSGIQVATIYTESRTTPIPDSSFSYRDLFSTIPNGEYLLRIVVHEVRDILSMHRRGGTTDPYIQVVAVGIFWLVLSVLR